MSIVSPLPVEPCFVAGPPFGPELFAAVRDHLGTGRCVAVPEGAGTTWERAGEALAREAAGMLLVAHGLAVPAALHAAILGGPCAVVVSNGPVTRVDPVTRTIARLLAPPGAPGLLLRPEPWLAWLRSSLGLRRAVANPYVMDRDIVAALCASRVADPDSRRALAGYLQSVVAALPDPHQVRVPTWAVWGDEDVLYPDFEADYLDTCLGGGRRLVVSGGRFVHPVERPWSVADRVATVAGMARSAG